jgi:hypothetical protein
VEMGPWMTRWFRAVLRDLGWELDGDILILLCCCCIGNQSCFFVSFSPFRSSTT